MFQEKLIKFCSPTLVGFKCGSLFKVKCDNSYPLDKILAQYNIKYNGKGVFFINLLKRDNSSLIYVYRPLKLTKNLSSIAAHNFLKSYGYKLNDLESDLNYLKYRFESLQKTPHEIGVFLGYPIWDVKGFIDNKGKDFKYCGTWKVYNNTDYAKIYFKKCKYYTNLYCKLFSLGVPLEYLILKNSL